MKNIFKQAGLYPAVRKVHYLFLAPRKGKAARRQVVRIFFPNAYKHAPEKPMFFRGVCEQAEQPRLKARQVRLEGVYTYMIFSRF